MNYSSRNNTIIVLFSLLIINSGFLVSIIHGEQSSPTFNQGTAVGLLNRDNPLDEASGLAASRKNPNVLWTHEDDWGPFVYAININGTILGKYQVGTEGYDVEDIAIGPGPSKGVNYLYIGHIGDNNANRSTIYIRRVPEPEVNENQLYKEINLTDIDTITLQYPDSAKDAETLMVDTNGDIYIVSKRLSSNKIYRTAYPQSTTETTTLELIAILPEKPEFTMITAGDISPNGKWIIVRNDQRNDYASIWHRTPETNLKQTFETNHSIIDINDEPQGEAICFNSEGSGFYTVSEHAGYDTVSIWYYQFLNLQATNQQNKSDLPWLIIIISILMSILLLMFIITKKSRVQSVAFGIIIIIAIGVYASTNLFEKQTMTTDTIENSDIGTQENVLIISYNSTDYDFSVNELISSFESVSGLGSKMNQIGKISNPDNYTGIPVFSLLQSIDELPDDYWLIASASDYTYNFSKENVSGKIECYNENGGSCGIGNMTMILAYEINDKFLDETTGGPLRIVFIDEKGSITHSSLWVSSVDKLIVIQKEKTIETKDNIPPIISINVSTLSGNAPLTIYFQANASDPDGYITSFQWDFGDGSSDYKKDTAHTYKTAGSYIVTFTVTDNQGDTSTKSIQININNPVINEFVSPTDFKDPSNEWENAQYTFDDNINTHASCTKKGFWKWVWTGYIELIPPQPLNCNKIRFNAWYDSQWCNEIDIDLYFNNKWNDIYQDQYQNKEWVTVEFPGNTVSQARVRFHLRQAFRGIAADLDEFDFYNKTTNLPPKADFSFSPINPTHNQNIAFSDKSYDTDGTLVSWNWDFGDGSESTMKNPSHTYSNVGDYEVQLTVTDNDGATNSSSQQITIGNQKPIADFSYTPIKPTIENTVYFTDKSTDNDGYITSWLWDFDDGNTSSEKNPSHQYVKTGKYEVKLTVKDNDNSVSETIKEITINEQSNEDAILTIIYNGEQKTYTLEDLENMVSISGYGGRLNVIGSIAGPFEYKGVPMSTLANEFSSLPPSYALSTISDDGYTYNYTQDEIQGTVQVYDTEGNAQGIGGVTMILAYEEEGIKDFPGGPLRIAYVDDEEQITDSSLWSKHVIKIEFFKV